MNVFAFNFLWRIFGAPSLAEYILNYEELMMAYAAGSVVTGGHLYRHGRRGLKGYGTGAAMAAAWPVYWILAFGVTGAIRVFFTALVDLVLMLLRAGRDVSVGLINVIGEVLSAIDQAFSANERFFNALWSFLMVITAGQYVYWEWSSTNSAMANVMVLGKALLWGALWPAYWLSALYA